jgi:hypothetical protein
MLNQGETLALFYTIIDMQPWPRAPVILTLCQVQPNLETQKPLKIVVEEEKTSKLAEFKEILGFNHCAT